MEMSERVYVSGASYFVYPCAFFGEKSSIFFVLLRPREVYLFVCSVHVSTKNNWFIFTQLFCKCEKSVVKAELVINSMRTLATVREVGVNEPEVFIFGTNKATFLIKLFNPHAINNFEWLNL